MTIRVNGQAISPEAVEFELKRLLAFYSNHMSPAEIRRRKPLLVERAKEQAIGAKLLMTEALRRNQPVPAAEIDAAVDRMESECGGPERLDEVLRKQGLTRQSLRQSILTGRRVDRLVAEITADAPEPTDRETLEYYREHEADYTVAESVNARHILVKPESDSAADEETARARLEEVRELIADGADFADMAAAHSDCPSGRRAGGSLGWITRGMMVPEFERALFSLEVGEISGIIRTQLGLHILEKVDRQPERRAAFDEIKDKIRSLLVHEGRGRAVSRFVEGLKQHAVIEPD